MRRNDHSIRQDCRNREGKTEGRKLPCIFVRSLNDYIYELETCTSRCSYLWNTVRSGSKYRDIVIVTMFQCSAGGSNQNILFDPRSNLHCVRKHDHLPSVLIKLARKQTFLAPGKGKSNETRRAVYFIKLSRRLFGYIRSNARIVSLAVRGSH